MKFLKKASVSTLIAILISTSCIAISNAYTLISREKAKSIMLNKVPGAKLVEFSYDYDDGIHEYEGTLIKGNREYDIKVNAITGQIIDFDMDYRDNDYNKPSNNTNTLIGEQKTKEIMLNKVPGAKLIYIDLDYDDSTPEYEGKLVKGNREYEISVHGYTGRILEFESEYRYDYSGSNNSNINTSTLIGEQKAKEIMLNKVPGSKLIKFSIDLDDRVPEYKGKLVKGFREYEVSVHAKTGSIIDFSSEIFDDVLGHWAESSIFDFYNKGYINGYSDNTFAPNNQMTRAEFVKTLNKVFNLSKKSGKIFEDTKNNWAKDEIDIAVTNGVCQGTSATTFSPNKTLTREEAATMIANYLNLTDTNHDKLNSFKDSNNASPWARNALEALIENGYLNGTSSETLSPRKNTNRAEAVTLLSRVNK